MTAYGVGVAIVVAIVGIVVVVDTVKYFLNGGISRKDIGGSGGDEGKDLPKDADQ